MLRLYAAGSNARGQLGSGHCEDQHTFQPAAFAHEDGGEGQTLPALPSGTSQVLGLACGANHTLVLLDTHELWVSGDSSRGQLAFLPSTTVFRKLLFDLTRWDLDAQLYKPTNVAAAWETSYVILTSIDPALSDIVLSFGADDFGDRGAGPLPPVPSDPSVVDLQQALSSRPRCIKVRELVAGQHHVLARLDVLAAEGSEPEAAIVGWGACRHGQLGALPVTSSNRPARGSSRVASKTTNKLDRPRLILTYSNEERSIQFAAGSQHSLILHSTNRITPLGSSRHGQLEIPKPLLEPATSPDRVQKIGSTWATSFFVSNNPTDHSGMTWCIDSCGSSNHGQLGRPPSDVPFGSITSLPTPTSTDLPRLACGSEHVLLHTNDDVWGWGWNEHGNLGLGHIDDVQEPMVVWNGDQRGEAKVLGVWAGCGTSWVLVEGNGPDLDNA
ncbi:hypothetical protein FRC09_015105 [Ceratobasidium sp. 395]|nr:hypothetical protein FRC09_015105 [Ceratobasidium sp. 395]